MFLTDYHLHSEFSFDSQTPVNDIVERAIELGISEIAITDHFDPCKADPDCEKMYDTESYFKKIYEAREKYGGRIKIAAGVEAGQAQLYPENVKKLLSSYPFDFVIGSVHSVTGDIDLAFESYTISNKAAWLERYFLEAAEAAKTGLYDVFGHVNYICRYIKKKKIPLNVHDYEDLAILVLRQVIALGKGIEVNISSQRDGGNLTMPPIELLKKYRAMGGEILTIGTDAHVLHHIGKYLEKGLAIAKRAGFNYIATFENRKPVFHKIEI